MHLSRCSVASVNAPGPLEIGIALRCCHSYYGENQRQMTSRNRIAFIGLGAMGYLMAGHLSRAGHAVTVFNRTRARADAWQAAFGGVVAATPAAAATDQDAVML